MLQPKAMPTAAPLPSNLRDPSQAPFAALEIAMKPEWVDHNGHLNMGYFMVAFDLATDEFLPHCGLGNHGRQNYGITTMTLEGHITYEREMMAGAGLRFVTQLLGFDAKRLHYMHFLYHAEQGYLASTNELITIAVDMKSRRSSAMPDVVMARLEKIWDAHKHLPKPPQQGRVIGIRSGRPA